MKRAWFGFAVPGTRRVIKVGLAWQGRDVVMHVIMISDNNKSKIQRQAESKSYSVIYFLLTVLTHLRRLHSPCTPSCS